MTLLGEMMARYKLEENNNITKDGHVMFLEDIVKELNGKNLREKTLSQIDEPESKAYQLGVMKNIEREMSKAKRKRTPNWAIVMTYLLGHTSKGGSTSCMIQCQFLGVNPDGFSFFEPQ